jgi:hypothetical protein
VRYVFKIMLVFTSNGSCVVGVISTESVVKAGNAPVQVVCRLSVSCCALVKGLLGRQRTGAVCVQVVCVVVCS